MKYNPQSVISIKRDVERLSNEIVSLIKEKKTRNIELQEIEVKVEKRRKLLRSIEDTFSERLNFFTYSVSSTRKEINNLLSWKNEIEKTTQNLKNVLANTEYKQKEIKESPQNFINSILKTLKNELESLESKKVNIDSKIEILSQKEKSAKENLSNLNNEIYQSLEKMSIISPELEELSIKHKNLYGIVSELSEQETEKRQNIIFLEKEKNQISSEISVFSSKNNKLNHDIIEKEKILKSLIQKEKEERLKLEELRNTTQKMMKVLETIDNGIKKGNDKNAKLGKEYLRLEKIVQSLMFKL